jgi:hypothetical protein
MSNRVNNKEEEHGYIISKPEFLKIELTFKTLLATRDQMTENLSTLSTFIRTAQVSLANTSATVDGITDDFAKVKNIFGVFSTNQEVRDTQTDYFNALDSIEKLAVQMNEIQCYLNGINKHQVSSGNFTLDFIKRLKNNIQQFIGKDVLQCVFGMNPIERIETSEHQTSTSDEKKVDSDEEKSIDSDKENVINSNEEKDVDSDEESNEIKDSESSEPETETESNDESNNKIEIPTKRNPFKLATFHITPIEQTKRKRKVTARKVLFPNKKQKKDDETSDEESSPAKESDIDETIGVDGFKTLCQICKGRTVEPILGQCGHFFHRKCANDMQDYFKFCGTCGKKTHPLISVKK